jgi:hypothetical protein
MKKRIKHYCLLVLTVLPIAAVSFAARSALNVAQIRNGNAADAALHNDEAVSGVNAGG